MKKIKIMFRTMLVSVIMATNLLSGFCQTGQNQQKAKTKIDNWLVLSIGGSPSGFINETSDVQTQEKKVITNFTMKIVMNRLGKKLEIVSSQENNEDIGGKLLKVKSSTVMSEQGTDFIATFKPGVIEFKTITGGKEFIKNISYTGEILGLEGIRLLSQKGLSRPGDSILYQSFIPDFGMVVKSQRKILAYEKLKINNKLVETSKVAETSSLMPGTRLLWLDVNGRTIQSRENSPFGEMVSVLSTKSEALLAANGFEIPAEQYASTVARSNVRLPNARLIDSMTIRIKQNHPEFGLPDFSGSYQSIVEKGKDYVVLKITVPAPGIKIEKISDQQREEYLSSNPQLDVSDSLIQEIINNQVSNEIDDFKKAIKLRNWVSENMNFDPGIAYAPSNEVVRKRKGTCVSYATLLSTLARGAGIPSRFLMGYVYMDGMWGGHAWCEMYIKDSWIPFDAAIVSPSIADAAHFHFARVSMSDGGIGTCNREGMKVYSNISVETIDYSIEGIIYKTEKATLFSIKEDKYINPGLRLEISKPANFIFSDTDKVFPDNILLSMKGRNREKVSLFQEYLPGNENLGDHIRKIIGKYIKDVPAEETLWKGKEMFKAHSKEKSVVAILNKTDIWILETTGEGHLELIDMTLKTLSIGE